VHYTDRRWNGLGLYGHYGSLAAIMLRDEYLHDQDLVVRRNGLMAIQVSPEGLHARVRPGTTGIPGHLYGCPITLECVDLPSQALPPDVRGPDQPTPILPLTITA
jgi:hypothetical protein